MPGNFLRPTTCNLQTTYNVQPTNNVCRLYVVGRNGVPRLRGGDKSTTDNRQTRLPCKKCTTYNRQPRPDVQPTTDEHNRRPTTEVFVGRLSEAAPGSEPWLDLGTSRHVHNRVSSTSTCATCGQRWQLLHRHPLQFGGRIFLALGAAHWQQQHAQQMIAASRSSQREQEARCVVGFGVRCNLYLKRVDSPPPCASHAPGRDPPGARPTTDNLPPTYRKLVGCRL